MESHLRTVSILILGAFLQLAVTQGQFLCTWNLHRPAITTTMLSKVMAVAATTNSRAALVQKHALGETIRGYFCINISILSICFAPHHSQTVIYNHKIVKIVWVNYYSLPHYSNCNVWAEHKTVDLLGLALKCHLYCTLELHPCLFYGLDWTVYKRILRYCIDLAIIWDH